MVKEDKHFKKILILSLLLLFVSFINIIYKAKSKITGFMSKEEIIEFYSSLPIASKIFLISQWTLIFILIIYYLFKEIILKKEDAQKYEVKEIASETELDKLYDLLVEKNEVSIDTIAKSFNISEKLALDWAKILESGNLGFIYYPKFGGPVLKIKK